MRSDWLELAPLISLVFSCPSAPLCPALPALDLQRWTAAELCRLTEGLFGLSVAPGSSPEGVPRWWWEVCSGPGACDGCWSVWLEKQERTSPGFGLLLAPSASSERSSCQNAGTMLHFQMTETTKRKKNKLSVWSNLKQNFPFFVRSRRRWNEGKAKIWDWLHQRTDSCSKLLQMHFCWHHPDWFVTAIM